MRKTVSDVSKTADPMKTEMYPLDWYLKFNKKFHSVVMDTKLLQKEHTRNQKVEAQFKWFFFFFLSRTVSERKELRAMQGHGGSHVYDERVLTFLAVSSLRLHALTVGNMD